MPIAKVQKELDATALKTANGEIKSTKPKSLSVNSKRSAEERLAPAKWNEAPLSNERARICARQ